MGIYGKNRRHAARVSRELKIDLKTGDSMKQIYSLDFSMGGIKIGGFKLSLSIGEQVELAMEQGGKKVFFPGRVARVDGMQHIKRIGLDGNTFFVRITNGNFPEFVQNAFHVEA